jgi:hypothetical protein
MQKQNPRVFGLKLDLPVLKNKRVFTNIKSKVGDYIAGHETIESV